MSFEPYRIFGWLVPVSCFAISTVLVVGKHKELNARQMELDRASVALLSAQATKLDLDRQKPDRRFAAAVADSMEETLFLNDLRQRMHSNGVILIQWTSKALTYGSAPTGQAALAGGANADLLKGITRVDCDLTVSGQYTAIREFVGGLTNSERLFALHNIVWSRSEKGANQLTLSLSRYVSPKLAVAPVAVTPTPTKEVKSQ